MSTAYGATRNVYTKDDSGLDKKPEEQKEYIDNFELDNIDWSKCIAVFGCSYIFGKGVEQHHGICHYIQELT